MWSIAGWAFQEDPPCPCIGHSPRVYRHARVCVCVHRTPPHLGFLFVTTRIFTFHAVFPGRFSSPRWSPRPPPFSCCLYLTVKIFASSLRAVCAVCTASTPEAARSVSRAAGTVHLRNQIEIGPGALGLARDPPFHFAQA